jgi:SAM-dependent methyltransferase
MDSYTEETMSWLDRRFRETDRDGIYLAHQPIYGFRRGHSEPGAIVRYVITYNILKALSHLRFASFLDVGGAEGYKAALVRAVFGAEVRSVDLSAEACVRAKAIFGVDGEPVDIQRLPYPDGAFDVVLCSETLEHVVDLQAATRELVRVAKRAVVITVPHEAKAVVARNIRDKVPHGHIHSIDTQGFDFALPLVASISCEKMLNLGTRALALAAEGLKRDKIRGLPAVAVMAFNRLVPLSNAVFGKTSIGMLMRLDRLLANHTGEYAGMTFTLLKDPQCHVERPAVQVSPRQVIDFCVPFHYPGRDTSADPLPSSPGCVPPIPTGRRQ